MAENTPPSWQPDPYGRFAQRYWDGNAWTANVTDASGTQHNDPPVPSSPAATGAPTAFSSADRPASTNALPVPGLVLAALGTLALLLSLFVLNWLDFGSADKAQVREAGDLLEAQLGVSGNDLADGIKLSEIRTVQDHNDSSDLNAATEQFIKWGYLVAVAAAAFAIAALFVKNLRWAALIAAAICAVWQGYTITDLTNDTFSAQFGAWLGVVGLVCAAVAQLLPRPASATSTA